MNCPQCSIDNPAGFKFCGNCGYQVEEAPSVPPPTAAPPLAAEPQAEEPVLQRDERRDVTVLFADVSGFTAMSEKLDPEKLVAAANSLRFYFARQGFQKDDLMMNARLKDGSVLVFRGTDRNGRVVLLLLHNPQNPKEEDQEAEAATIENLSLRLFYISDPISPDIFQIKSGDF